MNWAVEYTDCTSVEWGNTHPNKFPGFDTKQADGEVTAMMELWGMWRTLSLPWLQSPLWPGMVASEWALSIG